MVNFGALQAEFQIKVEQRSDLFILENLKLIKKIVR